MFSRSDELGNHKRIFCNGAGVKSKRRKVYSIFSWTLHWVLISFSGRDSWDRPIFLSAEMNDLCYLFHWKKFEAVLLVLFLICCCLNCSSIAFHKLMSWWWSVMEITVDTIFLGKLGKTSFYRDGQTRQPSSSHHLQSFSNKTT